MWAATSGRRGDGSADGAAAASREELLRQAAALQRQQREIETKLAELAELAQGLSEQEQGELRQHAEHLDEVFLSRVTP